MSTLRPSTRRGRPPFRDRAEAGRLLAEELATMGLREPLVLALPRGGVPVAREVADRLGAPLEVLGVRKLAHPGRPEFGFGAIAEDGTRLVDPESAQVLGLRNGELEAITARERAELRRRVGLYRDGRPAPEVRGRTVVVVDDGVATGLTDAAAVRALRRRGAARIVLAVPVCPADALGRLREEADAVVVPRVPARFRGVGDSYLDFAQVSDEEVVDALAGSARAAA